MTHATYKEVEYSVAPTAYHPRWTWTVSLGGGAHMTGICGSKEMAIDRVILAIDSMPGTPKLEYPRRPRPSCLQDGMPFCLRGAATGTGPI